MLQLKVPSFHANSYAAHMIPFFIRFLDFNVCPTSIEIHGRHLLGNFSRADFVSLDFYSLFYITL